MIAICIWDILFQSDDATEVSLQRFVERAQCIAVVYTVQSRFKKRKISVWSVAKCGLTTVAEWLVYFKIFFYRTRCNQKHRSIKHIIGMVAERMVKKRFLPISARFWRTNETRTIPDFIREISRNNVDALSCCFGIQKNVPVALKQTYQFPSTKCTSCPQPSVPQLPYQRII